MPKKYWTEDKFVNRVIEGDCIEVMRHLPNDCIDMVLCDLPYGTTQNKWDSIVPLDELWAEYKRIVKPNGAIVLTSQGLFTAALIMSQPKLFKYKWVWEKSKPTNFLNAKKQPLRKHEDVCVFYNKQPVYNPQMTEGEPYDKGVRKNQLSGSYGDFQPVHVHSDGKRYPTDVVYFKTAESEGEVFHATQKPVELALMEGRNFVGIEKNADTELFKGEKIDYIKKTRERLQEAWRELGEEKTRYLRVCNLIEKFTK